MEKESSIGIFDSGIGGISVYRSIRKLMPDESVIYLADQENMPYGSKELALILEYSKGITEFLLEKKCKIIVIACNTACAAALHTLRKLFPSVLFVGMEPAVKPAVEKTLTNSVGILATEGTFKGDPYAGVIKRFAKGVKVYEQPCNGLAEAIERDYDNTKIREMLASWIQPLKVKGIDQLALACTHYPLVIEQIKDIAGPNINVIDPAEAIARRVFSLLCENDGLSESAFECEFYTTVADFFTQSSVVSVEFDSDIHYCKWEEGQCLIEL